jgi:hypothetical protein
MHPDGRPNYSNSITVYVKNARQIARYWANNTGSAWSYQYGASINNATSSYSIMDNVSNVRVSVNSIGSIVGYNVTGVNKGQLNFTLAVSRLGSST